MRCGSGDASKSSPEHGAATAGTLGTETFEVSPKASRTLFQLETPSAESLAASAPTFAFVPALAVAVVKSVAVLIPGAAFMPDTGADVVPKPGMVG